MLKILATLEQAAEQFSSKTAVMCHDAHCSYTQLVEDARSCAAALEQLSIPKGALVGIVQPNGIEYLISYFGLLYAGLKPVLIDVQFAQADLAYLHSVGIDFFLTKQEAKFPLEVQQKFILEEWQLMLNQIQAHDKVAFSPQEKTVLCRLTSGSTGHPKCLEFTDDAVVAAAKNWAEGTGLIQNDQVLCLAVLSNGLAFNTSLLACILSGATLHLWKGYCLLYTSPSPRDH
jgi:acyl-CoA synthetase (AMP-forming)/AMP-acid ligase II